MVQPVVEQMETKPIVATGKFQLGPLAAAMSRCNLLITNDSGPMHVGISQRYQLWRFMDRQIHSFMVHTKLMLSFLKRWTPMRLVKA